MIQTKNPIRKKRTPKKYKTSPYIEQLARPRLGIITRKYLSPHERFERRRLRYPCRCAGGTCSPQSYFRPSRWLRRVRPATERVVELAQPVARNVSRKYKPPKHQTRVCRGGPGACTEIVRPSGAAATRTEQLALPYVRLLVATKRFCRPYASEHRIGVINKNMQRSMHTVYSRLANVKMPTERRKARDKWTAEQWRRYDDWAASRAKPKREFKDVVVQRPKRPMDRERTEQLAKPLRPTPIYVDPGHKVSDPVHPIKPAVLNFKMTPHYEFLATPFKARDAGDDFEPYENPFDVPREYAKITTVGIKQLAEPRLGVKTKRWQRGDNASVVFEVSKSAMKAKTSANTKKLAEPRKNMQEAPKANPFAVKPAACAKKPMPPAKKEYYDKLATPVKRGG